MDNRAILVLLLMVASLALIVLWEPNPMQQADSIQQNASMRQSDPFDRYSGTSDASAAIRIDAEHFLVADDEHNTLAVYAIGQPGPPLERIPWNQPLGIDFENDEHPESDIEGAARIGDRIYWITSHGRNKGGKRRPNRHQFFALDVAESGGNYTFTPVGQPYRDLAARMAAALEGYDPDLHRLVQTSLQSTEDKRKELAPKREGFNIEGLTAMADGKSLLVGLRNPRPRGKALLMPLLNPDDVLVSGRPPEFGEPILLDLRVSTQGETRELGIRSLVYSRRSNRYFIVGGPHDDEKQFALFEWSGRPEDPPQVLTAATAAIGGESDFAPEAAILNPQEDHLQLLSDDGSTLVSVDSPLECADGEFKGGQCQMKHLRDDNRKSFRSLTVPCE